MAEEKKEDGSLDQEIEKLTGKSRISTLLKEAYDFTYTIKLQVQQKNKPKNIINEHNNNIS